MTPFQLTLGSMILNVTFIINIAILVFKLLGASDKCFTNIFCGVYFQELVRRIVLVETLLARAKSLKAKFAQDLEQKPDCEEEMSKFVCDMLHYPEVPVKDGPSGLAGSIIHKLFIAAQKVCGLCYAKRALFSFLHSSNNWILRGKIWNFHWILN